MRSFLLQLLYTDGAYPNCTHIKIIVRNNFWENKKRKRKEKKAAQIGTNLRARIYNAGLLARSQFASGSSCDRPTQSRLTVESYKVARRWSYNIF
jgi:hypothetical protein